MKRGWDLAKTIRKFQAVSDSAFPGILFSWSSISPSWHYLSGHEFFSLTEWDYFQFFRGIIKGHGLLLGSTNFSISREEFGLRVVDKLFISVSVISPSLFLRPLDSKLLVENPTNISRDGSCTLVVVVVQFLELNKCTTAIGPVLFDSDFLTSVLEAGCIILSYTGVRAFLPYLSLMRSWCGGLCCLFLQEVEPRREAVSSWQLGYASAPGVIPLARVCRSNCRSSKTDPYFFFFFSLVVWKPDIPF